MAAIFFAYFGLTALIAVYRISARTDRQYWVNEGRFTTTITTMSICATQLGAGAILGTVASAYDTGIGYPIITIATGIFGFFLLGKLAKYFYPLSQEGIFTPAGLIGKYYGRRAQVIAGILSVIVYLNLAAAQLAALSEITRFLWPSYHILIYATLSITMAAYMSFGGALGDLRTDVFHFIVLSFAMLLAIFGPVYSNLHLLSELKASHLNPLHFGGVSIFVFGVVLGALFPLVSVELWQRLYAGKNLKAAQTSAWLTIPIISFTYILCSLIGLEGAVAYSGVDKNIVFFEFVKSNSIPSVFAIVTASIVGAILSATNGMILGVSSIFCVDIFRIGKTRSFISAGVVFFITILCAFVGLKFTDIVQLVLNASFILIVVAVPILFVMLGRPLTESGATVALALGSLSTIVSLPIMGKTAFLPGILISFIVAGIDLMLAARNKMKP